MVLFYYCRKLEVVEMHLFTRNLPTLCEIVFYKETVDIRFLIGRN